jgi:hypothetical protein
MVAMQAIHMSAAALAEKPLVQADSHVSKLTAELPLSTLS